MSPTRTLRLVPSTRSVGVLLISIGFLVYPGCDAEFVPPETNITVDPESATLRVGEILDLSVSSGPGISIEQINARSSDESTVTVLPRLLMRAVSEGMATLTIDVVYEDESRGRDLVEQFSIPIEVVAGLAETTIHPSERRIFVGESLIFFAGGPPDADDVVWSSDNPGVARVMPGVSLNTNATVTGVADGRARITVSFRRDGEEISSAVATVTVGLGDLTAGIIPNESTIVVGGTVDLGAFYTGTYSRTVWSSDDPDVARLGALEDTVSTSERVTGIAPGTATIAVEFYSGPDLEATATATVIVEQGGGGGTLEEGIWPLNVTGVEAAISLGQCSRDGSSTLAFGALLVRCGVAYAYENGFGVFDFVTQQSAYEQDGLSGTTGAIFAAAPVQDSGPQLQGGSAGFILAGAQGDGIADTEGNNSLAFGPTAFDAFPAGGDPSSGWASTAGPGRGMCTYGPDSGSSLGFNRLQCLPSQVLSGELVSSYHLRGGTDTPAFYLTRGVQSNVYYNDGSNTGFNTPVFQVGLDARRIRCAGDGAGNYLCGITIFGTDKISVFTYQDGGSPVLVNTIDVADGPVNLDMKYRSDGTYDIITSGFNDNRLVYLNLSANGAGVNARNFEDAPSGCSGLGHAIFLGDEDDAPVAGTCFSSGNIFLDFAVE